jgi:hypothetical protein
MLNVLRNAGERVNDIVIVAMALFFPIVILLALAGH